MKKTLTYDGELSERSSISTSKPPIGQAKNIICGYRQLTAQKVAA
jgi:hypothetical protein